MPTLQSLTLPGVPREISSRVFLLISLSLSLSLPLSSLLSLSLPPSLYHSLTPLKVQHTHAEASPNFAATLCRFFVWRRLQLLRSCMQCVCVCLYSLCHVLTPLDADAALENVTVSGSPVFQKLNYYLYKTEISAVNKQSDFFCHFYLR